VKFSIIHIEALSGPKAKVYSLKYEDKTISELQSFIYKFQDSDPGVIHKAVQRIHLISKRDGIQDSFFLRESSESHNIFRLLETDRLRLYCIMFSNIFLLFGSGGKKKDKTKKNVENPHLEKEIKKLMLVEDLINARLDSGELKITCDGFVGELNDFILQGSV